jgi:hypothetical protein
LMAKTDCQDSLLSDPSRFIRVVKKIGGSKSMREAINLIHHPDKPGGVWHSFFSCRFSHQSRSPTRTSRVGSVASLVLLTLLARGPELAADVVQANGEPDANYGDLRLWLRADRGVRDSAGHSPTDADFNGSVAFWNDQSPRHFDLTATPEQSPRYVVNQPGAGGRPAIAFSAGRTMARTRDVLHDHVSSTTLIVLQIQRFREQGNVVFTVGDMGRKREMLAFEHFAEPDTGQLRWWFGSRDNQFQVADALQIPPDGRFAIVLMRSVGDGSSVEVQDGLGDFLGANREMVPRGVYAVSDQYGQGYSLGGQRFGGRFQGGYDGQIAEVLVYNRDLTSSERRKLTAYLRARYDLDVLDALFPAGSQLLQAEDFDGLWRPSGNWDPMAAMCLGRRHVSSRGPQDNDGIRRTILVTQPGKYSVWVRAINVDRGDRSGGLRTFVGGKPLAVTHAEFATSFSWQLAGKIDLQPGETEIALRGEGIGRKDCDAVFLSPTINSLAGVEEFCALASQLRHAPSPSQLAAVFSDGRRIEGNLVSGFRGSGLRIARDGGARPAVRLLQVQTAADEASPPTDVLFEFHNGDRMRGVVSGFTPAAPGIGAQLLIDVSQELGNSPEKPVGVDIDWLKRIVFDASGPPRRCPPHSLVCRDGRVIAFRALRFSGEGVSLLDGKGLTRLAYRDLAEIVMQPMDAWEAYHRQLAVIDPEIDAVLVRVETQQGMVFTAAGSRASSLRAENEPAASHCLIQPAWSRAPISVAWSAVRSVWRSPAVIVPLSQFAPLQAVERGALGSSWKWQTDRSVAGGELRSGGVRGLWGFGVHAPNELVFALPDSALVFRGGLGIDASVGDSGCVVGKIYVNDASGQPLYQSPPLSGSHTVIGVGNVVLARGPAAPKRLVLVMDDGRAAQGANAVGLDIGNHADWLEPTLVLDQAKLRAAVLRYRTPAR